MSTINDAFTWVMPTYHPSFINRDNRKFEGLCMFDQRRVDSMLFKGWAPKWSRKNYVLRPTLKQVLSILKSMHGKEVSYDIETDGKHPLECTVRCVAFFDGTTAICIPFYWRGLGLFEEVPEPGKKKLVRRAQWTQYWTDAEFKQVKDACQSLYDNARLDSQNGQFDRQCQAAREGIFVPDANAPGNFDTLLAHHIIASYYPHRLEFLGGLYTEVPYYKADDEGEAWSSESDEDLWIYNCDDVQVQWLVGRKMREEVAERPEDKILYEHDSWYEAQGQRWSKHGMLVDQRALELFKYEYGMKQQRALAAMREILETEAKKKGKKKVDHAALDELMKLLEQKTDTDEPQFDEAGNEIEAADVFNPGSLIQLRLLLKHLGIPLTQETATGQLSTKKDFLLAARKELLEQKVPADSPQLAFLDFLFAWRECSKVIGTYLRPVYLYDGRVHASFKFHVVPTGRLSSSDNILTQPKEIRGMFVAAENYTLVAGDWDALEMRLGAFISGDPALIKVFEDYDKGGPKPHIVNASVIFDLPLTPDLPDKYHAQYVAAKTFAYATAYGAGNTTVFDQVREQMPDMEYKIFLEVYARYKKAYPKFFEFQRDIVLKGTHQRYLDSPILKRRVHYHERVLGEDSPEATKMQNMSYQSGGADVVSLANRRLMKLVDDWREKKLTDAEYLEQLCQVHDELMFEVPERMADEFCAEAKRITQEPVDKDHKHWRLPVDWKVKKPLRKGAPSRWAPVIASPPCCKRPAKVEYEKSELQSDCTVWYGECENDKCKSKGKKFQIRVPHKET